jgi:hypothetical protein
LGWEAGPFLMKKISPERIRTTRGEAKENFSRPIPDFLVQKPNLELN